MTEKIELGLTYDDILLVPQYSEIESRSHVDLGVFLHRNLKLTLPIIPANMDTIAEHKMAIAAAQAGSICFIHRFLTIEEQVKEVLEVKKLGLVVGAAVGVKESDKDRIKALIDAGADALLVDVAHGHNKLAGDMVRYLKTVTELPIVAGNVATADGVKFLAEAGADIVKVGIGPGAACTTRIVAGSGVPQFSAILECAKAAKETNTPIIADGGIYTSGAITKALAAGASAVMIGKLFAGTDEATGKQVTMEGKEFKIYRGMASSAANSERSDLKVDIKKYVPEGVSGVVPYIGPVQELFDQLSGGVRSGFSYSGARNIEELQRKAKFIQVTTAGVKENNYHEMIVE